MAARFHISAHVHRNKLSSLLPVHVRYWLPLLEDIAFSDAFSRKMQSMMAQLELDQEWFYVSLDATLKTCMKLKGQESYRAEKSKRDAAPFGDEIAWRRLLTARGRSGAVLLMHPLISEKSEHVVEALEQAFSESQLLMMKYVASDSPSPKLHKELKRVCPNMEAMCLDPVHLAIVYEYAQWNKKTTGSKTLRRLLNKFTVRCPLGSTDWTSEFFTGEVSEPLNAEEEEARQRVLPPWMPRDRAKEILANIDTSVPFHTRLEFILSVSAICALHCEEVSRKVTGANKEVYRVLWSACAPDRLEWLMNNVRVRMRCPSEYIPFLPSGTSSNEALHAELNSWNTSTNAMHRSTLTLKLRYYLYIKILSHHLACQHPMSSITSESVLLARATQNSLWSDADWLKWCAEQRTPGKQRKGYLPLAKMRAKEEVLVQRWIAKRPASVHKEVKKKVHVTPLTVRRRNTLRSAGRKSTN